MDLKKEALKLHAKHKGKIGTEVLTPIKHLQTLTLFLFVCQHKILRRLLILLKI